MKAFEIRPGETKEPTDALALITRPSPPLGPRDVRVRVRAASLNYRDLFVLRGAATRKAPVVPLSDGAGEVVEVGAEVTRWRAGDRVAASFFPTWHDGLLSDAHHARALGGQADGMLAEEVVLDEAAWIAIPARLSFEQAATLPCAGVTAYHALFEAAHVQPGDTVLVQGTGGVSIFALQLAKAAGARVVLTSKSAAKRERARELGADHVIDYVAVPAWGDAARAATPGGRGVDVAVEVGGQGTFAQSIAALRYGGTVSLIGVLTGGKGEIDLRAVFSKTARVAGVYVGSTVMFEGLVRALEAARIVPVIDQTFSWRDARAAYARLASGEHFGKIVVAID